MYICIYIYLYIYIYIYIICDRYLLEARLHGVRRLWMAAPRGEERAYSSTETQAAACARGALGPRSV